MTLEGKAALGETVRNLVSREREVELAYVFGSAAKGSRGKLSDIDVGVYLDESLSSLGRFRAQLRMMAELASLLKTNDVDLVVMNEAPCSLNYEIIRFEPVYIRDPSRRMEIESRIMSTYLDRRYYEKRAVDAFLRKVSARGLNW